MHKRTVPLCFKVQLEEELEVNGYDMKVKTAQKNERIGRVLTEIFKNKSLLNVAETLYENNLFDQAARSAGIAFEHALTKLCFHMGLIKRYYKHKKGKQFPSLDEKILLLQSNGINIPCVTYVKALRNDAIHNLYVSFEPEKVKTMIDITKDIERRM